jgi:hypothetical protein
MRFSNKFLSRQAYQTFHMRISNFSTDLRRQQQRLQNHCRTSCHSFSGDTFEKGCSCEENLLQQGACNFCSDNLFRDLALQIAPLDIPAGNEEWIATPSTDESMPRSDNSSLEPLNSGRKQSQCSIKSKHHLPNFSQCGQQLMLCTTANSSVPRHGSHIFFSNLQSYPPVSRDTCLNTWSPL